MMMRLLLGLALMAAGRLAAAEPRSLDERLAALERQARDAGLEPGGNASGIKISGYVDTSYIANLADRDETGPVAGSSNQNTGRIYDLQYNSFNLDAVEIWIEKEKDDSRFPAGFRMDLVYGDKANTLDGFNGMNDSHLYLEQGYVVMGIPVGNGLDVQMGKFCTLPGYEAAERGYNWCFSYSDGSRLLPGSHTGVLLNYPWTDFMKSSIGLVNGWDSLVPLRGTINYNTDYAFIGRVDFTNLKCDTGEFCPWVSGYYGNDDRTVPTRNGRNINLLNTGVVWDQPFQCQPLAVTFEYVHRNEDLQILGVGTPPVEADAFSLFAKWNWTDWTSTATRFGYSFYRNSDGGGLDPLAVHSGATRPDHTELYGITLCQNFNLWKDTLVRLEWQHDWTPSSEVGYGVANPGGVGPDDLRHEQDTLAVNVVYSF